MQPNSGQIKMSPSLSLTIKLKSYQKIKLVISPWEDDKKKKKTTNILALGKLLSLYETQFPQQENRMIRFTRKLL